MERNEQLRRMKELNTLLRDAARAYYQEDRELMDNLTYDRLYDELAALETETGTTFAGSVTQQVGYEVVDGLPKEAHGQRVLSLDKTRDVGALADWLGDQEGLLSWKLDGLTVVLTYEGGALSKAVTRGGGDEGEVITNNARTFVNLPLKINFPGQLILRGEALITYSGFEKINEEIGDEAARYKNPRNLCSGSVRQLDSRITAERQVHFFAFFLVSAEGVDFKNSREEQFRWLTSQGFDVVAYRRVDKAGLPAAVEAFSGEVSGNDLPSDGLVLLLDDIAYGDALGQTAKFPRNSIAFKWADEQKETRLRKIEWSASRTGLINPVAVFDPVELEGTTVSRASVHNVSILEELALGEGDVITVYKANMIIPQIAENLTRSGTLLPPELCPVCGGKTGIRSGAGVKVLFCPNPDCAAKKIKSFALFVSRDALNVDGLSEKTLEKLIAAGCIHTCADIFRLDRHKETITAMEGMGEKSFAKLTAAAEAARKTSLPKFIYGLGIPGIGPANARVLCRFFDFDFDRMRRAGADELSQADGIGGVLAESFRAYFDNDENSRLVDELLSEVEIEAAPQGAGGRPLAGQTVVITGTLRHFANRRALQERIEALGGRCAQAVSAKTTCLVNNDVSSRSAKNKKAQELGIPILSEEDFIRKMEGEDNADQSAE